MDYISTAIDILISEHKPCCQRCHILLDKSSLKYSEQTDNYQNELVFEILCRICGQIGRVNITFETLEIKEVLGNFDFSCKIECKPLVEEEVFEQLYDLLRQARSQQ